MDPFCLLSLWKRKSMISTRVTVLGALLRIKPPVRFDCLYGSTCSNTPADLQLINYCMFDCNDTFSSFHCFRYGFSHAVLHPERKRSSNFINSNWLIGHKDVIKTACTTIKFLSCSCILIVATSGTWFAHTPWRSGVHTHGCGVVWGLRNCWPDKERTQRVNKVWNHSVSMPSLSHLCVFSIFRQNSLLVMLMIEVAATTSLPSDICTHTHTNAHTHLQRTLLLLPVAACMCSPLTRALFIS